MASIDDLRRSVAQTLSRSRRRTGIYPQAERCTRGPAPRPTTDPRTQLRDELARLRSACAGLAEELTAAQSRRLELERETRHASRERARVDEQLEIVGVQRELVRRRREKLERSLSDQRVRLDETRTGRKETVRAVLEARDVLERLSEKLGGGE